MRKNQTFTFKIPSYLASADCVVKITKDGVAPCNNAVIAGNKVTLTDDVDMTSLYMLGDQNLYASLSAKYNEVLAKETFSYLDNKALYNELRASGGYNDENPYVPSVYKEQSTAFFKIIYPFAKIVIHRLEYLFTKSAAIYSRLRRIK